MSELVRKEQAIRDLMAEHGVGALLLERVSSFAWATEGGASYVNTAADKGEASLLITPGNRYVLTNNIEALRLRNQDEEQLVAQGWEFAVKDWWSADDPVQKLTKSLRLAADGVYPNAVDLSTDLSRLRANLSPAEGERFKELGALCAEAMCAIIPVIRPGMTEYEIAALLAKETMKRGIYPIVQQVATDERAFNIRHAIPTTRQLEKYAIISLCGRKYGLVASMTRAIHFGTVPSELAERHRVAASVDAALIAATRPGTALSDAFAQAQQAYADNGYPNAWQEHHQGGTAGYEPREYLGSPTSTYIVNKGQAFAWNPSVSGAKSEDTILVGTEANQIITATEAWPSINIEIDGQTITRAGILEV